MVESYEAPEHYTVEELRTRIAELKLVIESSLHPAVRAKYVRLILEYEGALEDKTRS
jgi:hypothetical protein